MVQLNDEQKEALELVRHELVALNRLTAADGEAPTETWTIDTTRVLDRLEIAFEMGSADIRYSASPSRTVSLD